MGSSVRRHGRRPVRRHWAWRRTLLTGIVLVGLGAFSMGAFHWGLGRRMASETHPRIASPPSRAPRSSPNPASSKTSTASSAPSSTSLPPSALISVPAQSQFPQLPNGCEVTSLSMLLTAVGHPVSKMTLAAEMPKDPTPLQMTSYTTASGEVEHRVSYWGNPNVGFVGSVYEANYGYGIYNGPMTKLLNQVLPGRAENLTGKPFSDILAQVARGIPVEVWTTLTFEPTQDWVTWNSPEGPVHATPLEHAVLLVGYKGNTLYLNNPWTGQAAEAVPEAPFISAWQQLGEQAITVTPGS